MKKTCLVFIGIVMLIVNSCQKDQTSHFEQAGTLSLNIGLDIREQEVKKGLKAFIPLSEFKVKIYKSDGSEILSFESLSLMPEVIELMPGDYYAEAYSDNKLAAEFDNPYYYGVSDTFSISSNRNESVTLICKLANTAVSIVWSDVVKSNYIDYSAKVVSQLAMLIYQKDEARQGYFIPSPLEIFIDLWYLNSENNPILRKLYGTIPDPLAGRHYEININTTLAPGGSAINVILDENEIPLEIIEINDDSVHINVNFLEYGDILITEIMFDPAALPDTEGEWIEIYNNSGHLINLEGLTLERDNTNKHRISSSIELLPGEYYVLARTSHATDAVNTYVYGTSITLPNNGAVLSLYNKSEDPDQGELIFSVNYGAANFPRPAGASISLDPARMNASDAVLGTSWCVAGSVYNTGDRGTPGRENDECL